MGSGMEPVTIKTLLGMNTAKKSKRNTAERKLVSALRTQQNNNLSRREEAKITNITNIQEIFRIPQNAQRLEHP